MNRIIFITLLLTSISKIYCQTEISLYYNDKWEITTKDDYVFERKTGFDFSNVQFDGEYRDFNKSGTLIGEGKYVDGLKYGIHKTFFSDEQIRSEIEYYDEDFTIRELKSKNSSLISSGTGNFSITFTLYHKPGTLKGSFKNYQKHGKWEYLNSDNTKHEEIYKNGEFKKGTYFSSRGSIALSKGRSFFLENHESIKNFNFDENKRKKLYEFFRELDSKDSLTTNIRFPGGSQNLQKNIFTKVKYPVEAFRNGIKGRVIVTLTVDANGEVTNYEVLKSVHESLDKEAIRVLKLFEKKWFPATLNGKPYESIISIPINFR